MIFMYTTIENYPIGLHIKYSLNAIEKCVRMLIAKTIPLNLLEHYSYTVFFCSSKIQPFWQERTIDSHILTFKLNMIIPKERSYIANPFQLERNSYLFSFSDSKLSHFFTKIAKNSHFPCSNQTPSTIFGFLVKFLIGINQKTQSEKDHG